MVNAQAVQANSPTEQSTPAALWMTAGALILVTLGAGAVLLRRRRRPRGR